MAKEKEKSFIDIKKESLEVLGFWDETYKAVMIKHTELMFKTDVLREWGISDIVISGDKFLFKWYKRHQPLSKEELKEEYGRVGKWKC